ncbi:MAG TPA: helix-turn-helix transcriptional regulator [Desulfobacteraceae bacterium]|nr:helix-turn-helix transcriptional regulator [Desulfobacteraceae bacterium]
MTDLHLTYSDQLIRSIFDSLSAHIAIIDHRGRILETNAAWRNFSRDNRQDSGEPSQIIDFTGMNYLHICEAATDEGARDAWNVAGGIREVIQKKRDEFLYDYPCHSPEGKRWFYMRAIRMAGADPVQVIVSHEDITELKLAQESLKQHQDILEEQNQRLEEANIALKVLIEQREKDKAETEKHFLTHIRAFVLPYISKLKSGNLGERDRTLLGIVEDQLNQVVSPLMQRMDNAGVMLTPQEMQVAALVKEGKTTAEIADVLYISETTVSFHRKNLRTKLGLKNKGTNLRSFLLSMS